MRCDELGDGLELGVGRLAPCSPTHSMVSSTHSFMFTPDATAATIVGILVLGCATSPWLQAAYFAGSIARTTEPSRSM